MDANKKRFLIIQLYSNGDCLYATTVSRQLKHDFPGCEITWAVAPFCSGILYNNPYIDIIWQVEYITDRSPEVFKANKSRLFEEAGARTYDQIFFTQIIDDNYFYYDGQVRSSIYAAFQRPITVSVEPVLVLDDEEKKKVEEFVKKHAIADKDFTILFECSPLSGQLAMDLNKAIQLSETIIRNDPGVRVILSSQHSFSSTTPLIIDGSVLSLRETAYLTQWCDLLLGCSSGITWVSTTSAAKPIDSIQLLDRSAYIFNSPTLDHERQGLSSKRWLEMNSFNDETLLSCIAAIRLKGFETAKKEFGQQPRHSFKKFRGIIHQFLSQGKFSLVRRFIARNYKIYGFNLAMMKSIFLGIFLFPFQLIINGLKKKKQ